MSPYSKNLLFLIIITVIIPSCSIPVKSNGTLNKTQPEKSVTYSIEDFSTSLEDWSPKTRSYSSPNNTSQLRLYIDDEFTPAIYPLKRSPSLLSREIKIGLAEKKRLFQVFSSGKATVLIKRNSKWQKLNTLYGNFKVLYSHKYLIFEYQGKRYNSGKHLKFINLNPFFQFSINKKNEYRGDIEFIHTPNGITLVNHINIEDYLRGVVPHEIGKRPLEELEALKAQAVAARTYTYKNINRRRSRGFDLYADVKDQMYLGSKYEHYLSDRAIAETRNIVLYHNDTLIHTYYHSTCGGKTANINDVWPGAKEIPYLKGSSDMDAKRTPWCQKSNYCNWKKTWTIKDFSSRINKFLFKIPQTKFKLISLTNVHNQSGRINHVSIEAQTGNKTVYADKSRWTFRYGTNNRILPSNWYTIKLTNNKIIAIGKGLGHGIGLCQYGAMARARAGQSFSEILTSYYKNTTLTRLVN